VQAPPAYVITLHAEPQEFVGHGLSHADGGGALVVDCSGAHTPHE
jgi:hypothetical protein